MKNYSERKIGLKDKNGNDIGEKSSLTMDLSKVVIHPRNNWLRLLLEAKNKGVNKIHLQFESESPLLRLKYTLKADQPIPLASHPNGFTATLSDVFFLHYIASMFELDVVNNDLVDLYFDEANPLNLKTSNGEFITLNEEYFGPILTHMTNMPEIAKFLKFKITNDGFLLKAEIFVTDSNKTVLLNKHRIFKEEIDENDPFLQKELEILCTLHNDEVYSVLKALELEGIFK